MKPIWSALAVATLTLGSAVALADVPIVTKVDGQPEKDVFMKGDTARYGVWHVKDKNWHVAVTTAGMRRHFKGRIFIEGDGYFKDVVEWKGWGEFKAEDKEGNWWFKKITKTPADKPKEIAFDVVSESKNISSVNFRVEGKGTLLWELCIGGAADKDPVKCETKHVKIGREGQEPPAMPFKTHAHPDAPGGGK